MIYDFSLLSSFLFASLLLLIIGYTKHLMQRLTMDNQTSGKAEKQYNSKRVEINCRLIIFIVFMIIITRLTFIITFPIEIQHFNRPDSILTIRTLFLAWQSIIIFSYVYFLFRIYLGNRLQDEFRYLYLGKTIKFYSLIAITDLLSSFLIYNLISYDLIYPVNVSIPHLDIKLSLTNEYITMISILVFIAGFILFFLRVQKKRTPFNFMGYLILHILTVSIAVYFMFEHLEYFFTRQSLLYSALDVFNVSTGFAGWIWLAIIFLGFSSQTFGYTIIRWKDKFINKQIAINYVVQLNKLSFVSVICVCSIAVMPMIFNGLIIILT